jgi:hypothetical protein
MQVLGTLICASRSPHVIGFASYFQMLVVHFCAFLCTIFDDATKSGVFNYCNPVATRPRLFTRREDSMTVAGMRRSDWHPAFVLNGSGAKR